MKIVIAGGGTGGHLFPGIAIAREVLRESGNEVLFVGTTQGIEARVLPQEGLPLRFISAGKLKGMKLSAIIRTMMTLPLGILQSIRLLRQVRPHAVVGVGGYASGPLGIAALCVRIPLILVEPNSYAGLANRKLGKLADNVLLCFPGTGAERFFPPAKTIKLGPLVRKGINEGDRVAAFKNFGLDPARFTLLVMGGSGGAHAINSAMSKAARLLQDAGTLQVLHQTGEKDAGEVKAAYLNAGVKAVALPFITDMAGAYAIADLVVSRSGATTIAELAVCGKRAVLIPFPFAADNHQEYNARTLAERGGVEVIVQKDLTPAALAKAIQKYREERAGASTIPVRDLRAAEEIAGILKTYV